MGNRYSGFKWNVKDRWGLKRDSCWQLSVLLDKSAFYWCTCILRLFNSPKMKEVKNRDLEFTSWYKVNLMVWKSVKKAMLLKEEGEMPLNPVFGEVRFDCIIFELVRIVGLYPFTVLFIERRREQILCR